MLRVFYLSLCLVCALAGCKKPDPVEDFSTVEVTLPSGAKIKCEVMSHPTDLSRGMMFRDALAADRGMLFLHQQPGRYSYWMYQVKIPLDIIWMDRTKTVVEISANTPPCPSTSARQCPHFGGNYDALYVLELAGGVAAKHGVTVGQSLRFF